MANDAVQQGAAQDSTAPPPTDVTADGSQSLGTSEPVEVEAAGPLQRIITPYAVIQGIADRSPRAMGGDATAQLVAAYLGQSEWNLESMRREIKDKDTEIRRLRDDLATATGKVDVLTERVGEQTTQLHVRGVVGVIGTWLFGLGMDQVKANPPIGAALIGIGVLMGLYAIVGWPRKWRAKA